MDLLLIDGDHGYDAALADILNGLTPRVSYQTATVVILSAQQDAKRSPLAAAGGCLSSSTMSAVVVTTPRSATLQIWNTDLRLLSTHRRRFQGCTVRILVIQRGRGRRPYKEVFY